MSRYEINLRGGSTILECEPSIHCEPIRVRETCHRIEPICEVVPSYRRCSDIYPREEIIRWREVIPREEVCYVIRRSHRIAPRRRIRCHEPMVLVCERIDEEPRKSTSSKASSRSIASIQSKTQSQASKAQSVSSKSNRSNAGRDSASVRSTPTPSLAGSIRASPAPSQTGSAIIKASTPSHSTQIPATPTQSIKSTKSQQAAEAAAENNAEEEAQDSQSPTISTVSARSNLTVQEYNYE